MTTLGASIYTFVDLMRSQKSADFLASHAKAFEFFGGVSEQVVPDDLKAAVASACRYKPFLNRSYAEMLEFFGTVGVSAAASGRKTKRRWRRRSMTLGGLACLCCGIGSTSA